MATMIPGIISDEVKSTGERLLFSLLKTERGTEDWIVLHSLNLTRHVKRPHGEIDFVILAPKLGVICLEVKSGQIRRLASGEWEYRNCYNEVHVKSRGPFEQAQNGMYSVMEEVARRHGKDSTYYRLLYTYGVAIPDREFDYDGPESEPWMIYDLRSRAKPICQYITRLVDETRRKLSKWAPAQAPSAHDVQVLANTLRPAFEGSASLQARAAVAEVEINHYTEEQRRHLDAVSVNPRILCEGPAGTGKTVLAVASARRYLQSRARTIFFCYNKSLGAWLKTLLAKECAGGLLTVEVFHEYLQRMSGLSPSGDKDYFRCDLPLAAIDALERTPHERYDALIMDEAQDLLHSEYLDVCNMLLRAGFRHGHWQLFGDLQRQAIFSGHDPQALLELLEENASFTRFQLSLNCRNTQPICETTSQIARYQQSPCLAANIGGPSVRRIYYRNKAQQLAKVQSLLEELSEQSVPASHIALLSKYVQANSCAADFPASLAMQNLEDDPELYQTRKGLLYSTIHRFKGLESPHVLLLDIEKPLDDEFRQLLYVGMSRAKFGLYLFINEKYRDEVERLLQQQKPQPCGATQVAPN